jgi:hypothetical protein
VLGELCRAESRYVCYPDSSLARRGDVDRIDTDSVARNDSAARELFDHASGDGRVLDDERRCLAGKGNDVVFGAALSFNQTLASR